MTKKGRIFLTGDIHGNPVRLSSDNFEVGKDLTKDDYVIVLGDFGLTWCEYRSRDEEYWINWLENKPWTTLFIDGNHERFPILNNLPMKKFFGGEVGILSNSVLHLKRGNVYHLNGRKILTIGGAHSHDREYRTWGKSMWLEEEVTDKDIDKAKESVKNVDFDVDYILTHAAPVEFAKYALPLEVLHLYTPDHSEENLSRFEGTSGVKFKRWYFGHYHNNIDDPVHDKWSCLYNVIVEVE